jgi:hypothetical protein
VTNTNKNTRAKKVIEGLEQRHVNGHGKRGMEVWKEVMMMVEGQIGFVRFQGMEWGEYVVLLVSYRGESGSKGRCLLTSSERGKSKGPTRIINQTEKIHGKNVEKRQSSDRFQTQREWVGSFVVPRLRRTGKRAYVL